MKRPLAFIDTETTSLRPDRRAWEVGLILRRPGEPDYEASWFVDLADIDWANADPFSLAIGGFYDRHPQAAAKRLADLLVVSEREVMLNLERVTRGAQLIGSNSAFEDFVLGARMRANGILQGWHYKPKCIADVAEGFLLGRGLPVPESEKNLSEELSRAVGVNPEDYDRHTAMGDCRWTRAVWDACHNYTPAGDARNAIGATA